MAETSIEWTVSKRADGTFVPGYTFNPWRGCTKVSAGCTNCYAETLSKRNPAVLGEWGPKDKRAIAAESYWRQPLKWDRDARKAGERRRVFCASLADVFEDRDDLRLPRLRLLSLIEQTSNGLDWLLLTKRPENVKRLIECAVKDIQLFPEVCDWPSLARRFIEDWHHGRPDDCVWLGVSVEDQKTADERIPLLLQTPAAVRFISAEPLLGPLVLDTGPGSGAPPRWLSVECDHPEDVRLDWVIAGGESGPGARPCNVAWVRSITAQCSAAGLACFVKQLGSNAQDCRGCYHPDKWPWPRSPGTDPYSMERLALHDKKGGDPAEWPEDLRVREFPAAPVAVG